MTFRERLDAFSDRHEALLRTCGLLVVALLVIVGASLDSASPIIAIRAGWTILTCAGTIVASVNCREALRDLRALEEANRDGTMKLQASGAVFDQGLKVAALGSDFLAGVFAFLPPGPMPLIMLCVSALCLINLSFAQERRRQRLLAMLRAGYAMQPADAVTDKGGPVP